MAPKPARLAYSTATAGRCPRCGWPQRDCRCNEPHDEPVPAKLTATLRLETKGRGGKSVTVVDGLPCNRPFLTALAGELKRACGSGGTAARTAVEIQGDHRPAIRSLLLAKGWTVKG
jgi:translation initiation factor 1